ncbi:MAG: hypothetical protein ACPG4T_15690, partial [Nannocystaceae bacterium]
ASTAGAAGGIGLGIYGAYEGSQGAGEDLKKLGLPDWLSTGLGALHGYGQMLTAGTSLPMAAGKSLITGQTFKSAMFGGKQTEDAVGLKNKGAHSRLDAALKAAQAKQGDDKSVEAAAANKEAAAANKEAAAANKEAAAMARSGGGPNRGNSPTQ